MWNPYKIILGYVLSLFSWPRYDFTQFLVEVQGRAQERAIDIGTSEGGNNNKEGTQIAFRYSDAVPYFQNSLFYLTNWKENFEVSAS